MGLLIKAYLPVAFGALLVLTTAGGLCAQNPLTVPELSEQRAKLDGKAVRIKGMLSRSHIGSLLKDARGQVAVRLRFEDLPKSLRKQPVVKDDLYRKLFDLANSIPDPEQPKLTYEVELVGVVKILKNRNYNVYKESPVEIYPVRVLRVADPAAARNP